MHSQPEKRERVDVLLAVTTLDLGGTEAYVENLAIGLRQRGVAVGVIADREPTPRKQRIEAAGVPVRVLGAEPTWTRQRYKATLGAFVERMQPNLIHANAWERDDWMREVANEKRIPFVVTGHHTVKPARVRDFLGLNRHPFWLYRRRLLGLRNLISIICISEKSLKHLRRNLGASTRARVVYNGVPEGRYRCDPGAGDTAPLIVWAGSMIPRKRPLLAIRAFGRALSRFPGCRLVMVGGGDLLPQVGEAARTLPAGSITVTGPRDSISEVLASAQILLHTSVDEGIPFSILEAISAGLPVVTTNAGAISEAVVNGTSGEVVSIDDGEAISDALCALIADPQMRVKYSHAALNHYRQRFTLENMVDETIAAYYHLCGVKVTSNPAASFVSSSQVS